MSSPLRPPIAAAAVGLAILLSGCTSPSEQNTPLTTPPIDAERVSMEEALGWAVQQSTIADLDNDGADERLVLAADAEAGPEGEPLWEDGHRWALWAVELATDAAGDSVRTLLYGAFVPNGTAEVAVQDPSIGQAPAVLILERSPAQVRVLEVMYDGPGAAREASAAYYRPRTWLTLP